MAKIATIPSNATRKELAMYYVEGVGPNSKLTAECWLENQDRLRYAYQQESGKQEKRG